MSPPGPNPRWYLPTPSRFLLGVLLAQVFLLMSEQFCWLPFNEKKGWTVLIAVAVVCVAIFSFLLWMGVSFLFRWRFQFGLRTLLLSVVVVAIPCSWFAVKMRRAMRQREVVEWVEYVGGSVSYHSFDGRPEEPPPPVWLAKLLGEDFLSEVHYVRLHSCKDEDLLRLQVFDNLNSLSVHSPDLTVAGLEHLNRLPNLKALGLYVPQVDDTWLERLATLKNLEGLALDSRHVTDCGLRHLHKMTSLKALSPVGTQMTEQGAAELQRALPGCYIDF